MESSDPRDRRRDSNGLSGVLKNLADLMDKMGDLADKGKTLKESGLFSAESSSPIKGVYGFSLKVGGMPGEPEINVQPFGTVHEDPSPHSKKQQKTATTEIREPLVDVLENQECVQIIAEIPGVDEANAHISVRDNSIEISATRGQIVFRKSITVGRPLDEKSLAVQCNNGILDIQAGFKPVTKS